MSSSILDDAELPPQLHPFDDPHAGAEGRNTFPLEGRPTLPDDMFRNVVGLLETTAVMPNAPPRPPHVEPLVTLGDLGDENVRTPRVLSLDLRRKDEASPTRPRDTTAESWPDSPPRVGEPPVSFPPREGASPASVSPATASLRSAYSPAPAPFPATDASAPAPFAALPTSLGFVLFAMPLALATMAVATLALR